MLDRRTMERLQRDTGFDPNTLEKAYHLTRILHLLGQNSFLSERLTLKGGTALNFVYLDLPRLSIDLDFNYTGALERETMLAERQQVLNDIEMILSATYRLRIAPSSYITERLYAHYTNLMERPDRIKIELSFLERLPVAGRRSQPIVPLFAEFQSTKVWTYALEELLAMKLKTLLERSYPRDLWDAYQVIQQKLDFPLLQKLLVIYVCFIPSGMDFLDRLTTRLQQFDSRKVRGDLHQLVRKGGEVAKVDIDQMIKQITNLIKRIQLQEAEVEFLKAFSQGRIQAELLFEEEQAKQLNRHPSLLLAVGKQEG